MKAACIYPLVAAVSAAFVVNTSQAQPPDQMNGMDGLVAPVALYPDPLLGLVLPASTAPNDLQAAAQDPQAESQSWAPAVQDLAHYPDVVQWMAQNQDWSNQLGSAFASDPRQVMDAVQDLRRQALAAGTLQNTPQQVVLQENGYIQILPAQENMVYVPQYDPQAVFYGHGPGVGITFSAGFAVGPWLSFFPVWRSHDLYTGDWYSYEHDHGGWRAGFAGGVAFTRSGVRGTKTWHVARDAQIRSENFRTASHPTNYARPNTMGSNANAAAQRYGYQGRTETNRTRNAPAAAQPAPNQNRYAQQQQRTQQERASTFQGDQIQNQRQQYNPERSQAEARPNTPAPSTEQKRSNNYENRSSTYGQNQANTYGQTQQKQNESRANEEQKYTEQNNRATQSRAQANANESRAQRPSTFEGDQGQRRTEPSTNRSSSAAKPERKAESKPAPKESSDKDRAPSSQ